MDLTGETELTGIGLRLLPERGVAGLAIGAVMLRTTRTTFAA